MSEANEIEWRLVIGQESETWAEKMRSHEAGEIVYLPNDTLQVFYVHGEQTMVYEVDLGTGDSMDWLMHLTEKPWASREMLFALASAARRIKMVQRKPCSWLWSNEHAVEAVYFMENRNY